MAEVTIARLTDGERAEFSDFCRDHWPGEHPLIHRPDVFEYYYRDADGGLNFAVARDAQSGELFAVCGYIKTNRTANPDLWLSYLLAKKGAPFSLSFKLIQWIAGTVNARTVGCNNIRPAVFPMYEFLGYTTGPIPQFYRFNPEIENYTICKITDREIPSVEFESLTFSSIDAPLTAAEWEELGLAENKPYKDRDYYQKRYLDYPWIAYELFAGRSAGGALRALVALRVFRYESALALRVVDYVGAAESIAAAGAFLDREMRARGAEFCDWFAAGIPADVMARAGFRLLEIDGGNIVPLYLDPPRMENTPMYCAISDPEGYRMFRADGDQDRKNSQ